MFGLEEGTSVLDYRVDEMMHTFCGTMTELKEELRAHAADRRPLFVHTRPLDLHIGNTRFASVPAGRNVSRILCAVRRPRQANRRLFRRFLDELKRTGLYDNSIIVLTSDHGDSLGEGLRWGHGYTIVSGGAADSADRACARGAARSIRGRSTRVSFATDMTPSLYALPGYHAGATAALGRWPLFNDRESSRQAVVATRSWWHRATARCTDVRHNGRRLYIADAIEGRDAIYDLTPGAGERAWAMTDAERQANRALIREQIADLAAAVPAHPTAVS